MRIYSAKQFRRNVVLYRHKSEIRRSRLLTSALRVRVPMKLTMQSLALHLHDEIFFPNLISRIDVNLLYRPRLQGDERVLHLHRLDNRNLHTFVNRISGLIAKRDTILILVSYPYGIRSIRVGKETGFYWRLKPGFFLQSFFFKTNEWAPKRNT